MKGVVASLTSARADAVCFTSGDASITAGMIRASAARAIAALEPSTAPLYVHTQSAALFCAALLAAAATGRRLSVLPQAQPGYLADIAAPREALLIDHGETPTFALHDGDSRIDADDAVDLDFFTSGSTGAPKIVPKKLAHLEREIAFWESEIGGRCDAMEATVSHQHVYGMLFRVVWPVMGAWRSRDIAALAWEQLEGALGPRVALASSPAHLSRLPPAFALKGGPPAFIFSSGQMLAWPAAQATAALFGAAPTEILGSTETGGVAWRLRTAEDSLWTPLNDVSVSTDEDGALHVSSPYFDASAPMATGDRIQRDAAGGFRLLGRVDRIAKIDGKRVSLSRVEEALRASPLLADAATLALPSRRNALGAVATLTEAGRALLADEGAFRFTRRLRTALSYTLEPAERPKHWRFVGAIPVNSQGKRQLTTLARLFEIDSVMSTLKAAPLHLDAVSARLAFTLTADMPWFQGHFRDAPVMPGVAQVHLAARLAEELWGFEPSSHMLTQVKFKRLLKPDRPVLLDLDIDAATGVIAFAFTCRDERVAEGRIGGG
ncbi:MAG: AMP-dependent synthetase [Hyphomonadaceae bacterium]|nr:AMP-dependent synthetase [Hyphomonadaceae bacterium]